MGLMQMAKTILSFEKNRLERKLHIAGTPDYYSLAVTFRCNSHCATCGIWNSKPEPELNTETWARFFKDKLVRKAKGIEITGGEPTLRSDLPDIIASAYENCLKAEVRIGTNCILPDRAIELADTFKRKGIYFSVSLDGIGELHDQIRGVEGNYEKVMQVINYVQQLRSEGYPTGVGASICVSILNVTKIPELTNLLDKLQVPYQLTPYLKTVYGHFSSSRLRPDELDFITEERKAKAIETFSRYNRATYRVFIKYWKGEDYPKPPCYVLTKGAVAIRPNGDIPICMYWDRQYILGNIANETLSEIWKSPHVNQLRERFHNCRECASYNFNMCDNLNNYCFHGWAYRDTLLMRKNASLGKLLARSLLS